MEIKQTPIQRACEIVGSQANMARILGVSPSVVNQWIKELRPVPAEYCMAIVTATNNAVTCFDLLPDDWQKFWPELAEVQAPAVTGELSVPRAELVEAVKAGLIKDPRQNTRRAADRKG